MFRNYEFGSVDEIAEFVSEIVNLVKDHLKDSTLLVRNRHYKMNEETFKVVNKVYLRFSKRCIHCHDKGGSTSNVISATTEFTVNQARR